VSKDTPTSYLVLVTENFAPSRRQIADVSLVEGSSLLRGTFRPSRSPKGAARSMPRTASCRTPASPLRNVCGPPMFPNSLVHEAKRTTYDPRFIFVFETHNANVQYLDHWLYIPMQNANIEISQMKALMFSVWGEIRVDVLSG